MLSFFQFVTEIYNEPDDSTFTDNGSKYDLDGLLSATLGMETQQFSVDKLIWIFQWDNPFNDPTRVDTADLSAPILVTQEKDELVVVDGLHRLAKAAREYRPTIKGILVHDDLLKHYRLA